ncbi:hypothetical protein MM59RIKEN_06850 [Pusillibacter faecalis]|uniref:Uncharacterized protein n=1 Tax=Pusillibacter faecalis TaxID=2714358 RepID=A0A810QC84_9FIRM|nr:hypothetical protein MM59RIKEN_06850 [Pusillibacter faecalis]
MHFYSGAIVGRYVDRYMQGNSSPRLAFQHSMDSLYHQFGLKFGLPIHDRKNTATTPFDWTSVETVPVKMRRSWPDAIPLPASDAEPPDFLLG